MADTDPGKAAWACGIMPMAIMPYAHPTSIRGRVDCGLWVERLLNAQVAGHRHRVVRVLRNRHHVAPEVDRAVVGKERVPRAGDAREGKEEVEELRPHRRRRRSSPTGVSTCRHGA